MIITLFAVLLVNSFVFSININQTHLNTQCLEVNIANGNVSLERGDVTTFVHIVCHSSYDIIGPAKVECINGKWNLTYLPKCVARCDPPPFLWNGGFQIEGDKGEDEKFKKGTLVTYTCSPGFYLLRPQSKYRICKDGMWTGVRAYCEPAGCKAPEPIKDGYYVHENAQMVGQFAIGERLHYNCNIGSTLSGTLTQKCLSDGTWSPKIQPKCIDNGMITCPSLPNVAHSVIKVISGFQVESTLTSTEIEISCMPKYHNIKAPCRASRLKCIGGEWIGILPKCVSVISKECPPPPDVRHGTPFDINAARYEVKLQRYLINMQISYHCMPGYEMRGNEILTCSSGCWTPSEPPTCQSVEEPYIESNASGQIVISLVTGTGVLLLLVVICLVIVCRRRKPLSRAVSIQPSLPRPDLADHAALLHHPDRLALIAFADGMQVGQPVLPTYEEAIRDRVPGCNTSTRIPRPHWPSLVARRSRNSPNPDSIHVTRQGSFASHSASIRSDPQMGSTDTMAVSENSTTVTLDTASSHSGSQPASCRAHCGSLASFDTSSVLNTEGVPLLEENELEEVQCGDDVSSLAMENRSMTDNVSFKLSTTSDVA